jgi:endogenous inhibitor of DNA gyrase (YacG/DUF329 family)
MSVTRNCEQCGREFTAARDHARFCSVRCRVYWNRASATGSRAAPTQQDVEHLDEYELWALDRLEPLLGWLRVIDRKGGPPGQHDFEADLPGGLVASLEVTSEVESDRLSVASEIRRRGMSRYPVSGLDSLWSVRLSDDARVKDLSRRHDELRQLLSDLEAQGARWAHNLGDYRDPVVRQLRALGIGSVYRLSTGAGGGVVMGSDSYGGFGWDGPVIDAWLDGLLASGQGINKLDKLDRAAHAAERHLVVVLDSFSQAGMGIPLGLTDRDEPGAAPYVMPSLVPSKPLTHMWLLPTMASAEGLRWARDGRWMVFQVPVD